MFMFHVSKTVFHKFKRLLSNNNNNNNKMHDSTHFGYLDTGFGKHTKRWKASMLEPKWNRELNFDENRSESDMDLHVNIVIFTQTLNPKGLSRLNSHESDHIS